VGLIELAVLAGGVVLAAGDEVALDDCCPV
jgi:hypothetical protein